jgi:molecular chaperone DnaK (HSP70)
MPRYSLGIDLGTTNCALAAVELTKRKTDVLPFDVTQLIAPGELADRALLPSFLYLPGEGELPAGSTALPWDPARKFIVGELARSLGAKVPGRLVASAKSWLCHGGVDRTAAILPWGAPSEIERVSAVEASTRYLRHLAEAWNHRHREKFEEQDITLTVPASFDDVARLLTAEAARHAGLQNVTLLEEPQAAFYAWIAQADRDRRRKQPLKEGMTCLVADVGGGTTDFSLIECVAEEGALSFIRKAVGDHLLLGGDNMDLALAHRLEEKLNAGKLDAARFAALAQACRAGKERLLGPKAPKEVPVTIMGRGRAVVAASLSAPLTRDEVLHLIGDGFFPNVPFDAEPRHGRSGIGGLHEMGLPYVGDPAITTHLATFLRQHGITAKQPPDAILYNGGVFTPAFLRDRLVAVMKSWFGEAWSPILLATPSLDLAVALGAAYYGRQRQVGGRRILGGLARSYYIGVATGDDHAASQKMLCVVPQHMEEGQTIELHEPVLELALGQPVQFPIYTSTVRDTDAAGQTLRIPARQLLRLAPLQSLLRGGKRAGAKGVPVTLTSTLTPVGTLELSLVAQNSPNRWRLEFNTRDVSGAATGATSEPSSQTQEAAAPDEVLPEDKIQAALDTMHFVYSHNTEDPARQLTKMWENHFEMSRRDWPMSLCRRLGDALLEQADHRRRSPAHLSRWYHLTGYCLRPGVGDAKDPFRLDQVWKLLGAQVRQAGAAQRMSDGGADYWILWRRLSAGLSPNLQLNLLERLRPILLPGKAGAAFKPNANELAEMWRMAASLERLEPKLKELLAAQLLRQYRRPPALPHVPWALARLGARTMLYAPLNHVVPADAVSHWVAEILRYQPGHDSDRRAWLWTLTNLTRRTNVRGLDIDDALRTQVLAILRRHHAPPRFVELIQTGGELQKEEQQQMFGEDLPLGLRLVNE